MATRLGGTPPGPHAGDISPRTAMLRPRIALSEEQCIDARRLRRKGISISDVATKLDADVEHVRLALAAMRTRRQAPTRATLNVTLTAQNIVRAEQYEGEAVWQTVDRLLGELKSLRRRSLTTKH